MNNIERISQRWSRGHNIRGHRDQGLIKSEAKDRIFEKSLLRQRQEWSRPKTKDTIFFLIMVGKFSIIFKRKVFKTLHFLKFLMIIQIVFNNATNAILKS